MTPDQLAVFQDARMSREARMVALHISCYGEGEHEIPNAEFRQLLGRGARGMVKDQTLASYVGELEDYGWVTKNPGGQGSPRYIFTPPQKDSKREVLPTLGSFTIPQKDGKESLYPPTEGDQSLARASSSSLPPPPPPPLGAQAREFVDGSDALVGCRDSLADYLAERVEPIRQLAYAQSVAGIIEGTDEATWMMPDGSHYRDERAKLVAGCLNEMRAGDEVGQYFRGPPGDVRNLKSKIRYQVKSIAGAKRDAQRRKRRSESGRDPSEGGSETRRQTPDVHVHG